MKIDEDINCLEYQKAKDSEDDEVSFQTTTDWFSYSDGTVFLSDDGEFLYYFDLSNRSSDFSLIGDAPLYRVTTSSLILGNHIPILIDEHVPVSKPESHNFECILEPIKDTDLLYVVDITSKISALKYYDGISSVTLLEGCGIECVLNSEKTLAYVGVSHDSDRYGIQSWYRVVLENNPIVEYICDGVQISRTMTIQRREDLKGMIEKDVFISVSDYPYESGYMLIGLTQPGTKYRKI